MCVDSSAAHNNLENGTATRATDSDSNHSRHDHTHPTTRLEEVHGDGRFLTYEPTVFSCPRSPGFAPTWSPSSQVCFSTETLPCLNFLEHRFESMRKKMKKEKKFSDHLVYFCFHETENNVLSNFAMFHFWCPVAVYPPEPFESSFHLWVYLYHPR